MKLSDWAKSNGLVYQTAYNLYKKGQLPGKITQLPSGTILISENSFNDKIPTYIYCRVSSNNKKEDLERQANRCIKFCETNGWQIEKVIKEVASGMNDNRKKLLSILDNSPKRIVVEHKDRLTRFGFNFFDKILPLLNYELIVINRDSTDENDLMKDLVSIITSFCCRLYGLRKGKNKIKNIKKELSD